VVTVHQWVKDTYDRSAFPQILQRKLRNDIKRRVNNQEEGTSTCHANSTALEKENRQTPLIYSKKTGNSEILKEKINTY